MPSRHTAPRGGAKAAGKSSKGSTANARRDTRQGRANKSTLLDAAVQVLGETKRPVNAREVVEQVPEKGLWHIQAKTPAATRYAAIFEKVGRGEFGVRV